MSTSRVESMQHTSEMNEPRSEVDLEINTMTHGETEAMTSDRVIDHELEIAPHGEHGVTNENEEKEDELQEQVVMDARPKRARKMLEKLKDYVCHAISVNAPTPNSSFQLTSLGNPHTLSQYISYSRFSNSHRAYLVAITHNDEPSTYSQAIRDPHWKNTMAKEIAALESNNTWTIETMPLEKKAGGGGGGQMTWCLLGMT
ncbi:hypothetical protein GH714_033027 [Hevea brasiliensis]|uniref:Uncharacterized protein n=1 Tax=Hevea brasiliensis TaxID=3981 RepID=A0A6A6NA56_HEVBR|nr:hypothetical protein GH714_033027 [Hevea brasiliensis]